MESFRLRQVNFTPLTFMQDRDSHSAYSRADFAYFHLSSAHHIYAFVGAKQPAFRLFTNYAYSCECLWPPFRDAACIRY